MIETPAVRRHSDGSIDFDFYRARAAALRRQAIRDLARERMPSAGRTVMVGALGFAVLLPSTSASTRDLMAEALTNPPPTR